MDYRPYIVIECSKCEELVVFGTCLTCPTCGKNMRVPLTASRSLANQIHSEWLDDYTIQNVVPDIFKTFALYGYDTEDEEGFVDALTMMSPLSRLRSNKIGAKKLQQLQNFLSDFDGTHELWILTTAVEGESDWGVVLYFPDALFPVLEIADELYMNYGYETCLVAQDLVGTCLAVDAETLLGEELMLPYNYEPIETAPVQAQICFGPGNGTSAIVVKILPNYPVTTESVDVWVTHMDELAAWRWTARWMEEPEPD